MNKHALRALILSIFLSGLALLLTGCLPLMAASAAGTVVYYNMPQHHS
ncbi:DUF3568 domain-containing protein [Acidithiobacillus montserratensis]|uniref:DUF3568 domain-containing protein n=1 Tax=Acidithiobacillus montserratensis TaxID=2729135 RepID=A0ACD5HFZ4_9PROT|nr:DUF3568 domain-containing protein [Acidithiobacillus montserratensis]MBN2680238.1 hypothetical protein [Acidithiobacillaceae bacterium]MBU2747046.1 hypothetical protein [Acidithiobacillus montserratensis]